MKETSFGLMQALELPFELASNCEVMQFREEGAAHQHDVDEVAVCVTGAGRVWMDGSWRPVKAGEFIHIPAGTSHYMEPNVEGSMAMLIAYESPARQQRQQLAKKEGLVVTGILLGTLIGAAIFGQIGALVGGVLGLLGALVGFKRNEGTNAG